MCAVTNSIPHNGCTTLNPICNGGTSCVCDPSSSLSCSSDNHSTCNGYATMSPFSGGSCICGTTAGMGTNSACTGNLPSCKATNFGAITDATSATCQVKAKKCNSLRPIKYYLWFSYDYCWNYDNFYMMCSAFFASAMWMEHKETVRKWEPVPQVCVV